MSKNKSDMKFVQRGDKIEVITNTPKQELTPFDVLGNIVNLQQAIQKTEEDIAMNEHNLVKMKQALVRNGSLIKQFEKHADWARKAQESLFKNVVESMEQEFFDKVEKEYKYDEGLTDEQNIVQKYHQFRQYISTDKRMSEKVAKEIISTKLWEENYLSNPWKPKS